MFKCLILFFFFTNLTADSPLPLGARYPNENLFHYLTNVFGCETFIETGTFKGKTTAVAAPFFKTIHTIELGEDIYQATKLKLAEFTNIQCHLGDSAVVFPKLIERCKNDKMLIFLDAHWSQQGTAHGGQNTAVCEELNALETIQPDGFVLLLDDLRDFRGLPQELELVGGYPKLTELVKHFKDVFPTHEFWVLGDLGLLCPKSTSFSVSTLVKACTASLLYKDQNPESIALNDQMIIAHGHSVEAKELTKLRNIFANDKVPSRTAHIHYWAGLVLMGRGQKDEAMKSFNRAQKYGYSDWRLHWFRAKLTRQMHISKSIVNSDLKQVAKLAPQFTQTQLWEEFISKNKRGRI